MVKDKNQIFEEAFLIPVGRTGKWTVLAAVVCLFVPGLYLHLFHDLFPPVAALAKALIAVWSFSAIIMIIEPIVYYPILGFGGTYMGFLVGNILNLRVPVSATAQQVVGAKEGTPEAEIASTLGIAGSIISNEAVLIVGIVAFLPAIDQVQQSGSAMAVALDQVLPALFGALGGVFLFRVPKLAATPLLLGLILALISASLPYSVVIPPMVIISIAVARLLYKKGWVGGESMM